MSKSTVAVVLALFTFAEALTVDFSDNAWKEKPITKVIGLLKDMQAQISKEAEEDEEMYEKLGCWCETNDKEKTKAIADANHRITDLTAAIESYTAKTAQLETEIEKLNKDIAKDSAALAQASEVRSKENSEFAAEEKDMMATVESLKGAVGALGKAHGDAAALSQQSLMQVQSILRHHMQQHKEMFHESLSPRQHKVVLSLLQQQAGAKSSYEPASGAIFGILKQMKESFETNIANSQKDEAQAASEYASLKAAKEEQIKSAEDLVDTKSVELADAQNSNAQSKQDKEDTEAQLAADTTFLENLKAKCENADKEYEERQKVRSEEIQAVSETIGILTSDEAQSSFSKSSSFIQLSMRTRRMSSQDQAREKAARVLRMAGMRSGDKSVLALAQSVKKDMFAAIKKNIAAMIEELKKTQKEEADKYEFCTSELKSNGKETASKQGLKADLEQKIEDLTATVSTLTEEIAALKAAVAEANVEMKKASENREKENADFQVTVQDQKATQVILKKALDKLKSFYGFLQTRQTPPPQATYKKSGGSTAVMMMIEQIINESKDVEKKALNAENDAQSAYEEFIADSNASIAAAAQDIMNKSGAMAQADKEKVAAEADLAATIQDLLSLGEVAVALHQDCDFLIKNFEIRQTSRSEEIEALNNAIAIFSGANFGR